jgi:hypothetical protein
MTCKGSLNYLVAILTLNPQKGAPPMYTMIKVKINNLKSIRTALFNYSLKMTYEDFMKDQLNTVLNPIYHDLIRYYCICYYFTTGFMRLCFFSVEVSEVRLLPILVTNVFQWILIYITIFILSKDLEV